MRLPPVEPSTVMQEARRSILRITATWLGLSAVPLSARAAVSTWLPYAPNQIGRIDPVLTDGGPVPGMVRIDPQITRDFEPSDSTRTRLQRLVAPVGGRSDSRLPAFTERPPRAYVRTGERFGVPPWLLYGVALQESQVKFGQRALPYPWTLCVQGQGQRFASYEDTLAALRRLVAARVTNVDCGAMQVNWRWHSDKLGSFERALDPYPNLGVGAQILRGHFEARRDWRQAVALYHTGGDATAEQRQRGARYAGSALARLSRLGVDLSSLINGGRRA